MSVQRRSLVSTGPTRDDPAVNQIWAEWRSDESGLRQRSPGVLVSVTVLSTWFIVLIYGRLTLTWGSALACPFFVTLCWLASCYSTTSVWVRIIRISVNLRCVFREPDGCREPREPSQQPHAVMTKPGHRAGFPRHDLQPGFGPVLANC